jgi:hypothetical protein
MHGVRRLKRLKRVESCGTGIKKDRHSNSLIRKIPSVNFAYFRYYQRTSDGSHMRCFAEKLRIRLQQKMHGSLRKMAIEQRNYGCSKEIGSFDANQDHADPQPAPAKAHLQAHH